MQIKAVFDENLITPRRHKQLMNLLLRREMEKHRRDRLPAHFQKGADRKYGYAPISKGYAIKKAIRNKEIVPMVLTGRMRDTVLATSKVTATDTRSRLYARNYFPMKDYFRSQVEKLLPSEESEMADNIGRNYAMLANTSVWARKRSRS